MINVTFLGRVGSLPETRTAGQSTVTKFTAATDRGFGDKKKTEWVKVEVWGKRGDALQEYLEKGQQVVVTGDLWHDSYEKDGVTKQITVVTATNVEMIRSASHSDDSQKHSDRVKPPARPKTSVQADDDTPF